MKSIVETESKKSIWKSILSHSVAVSIFLVLTLVYFNPVLGGKDIRQDDAIGSMGWGKDARDYHEKTGEYSYWSNSMFSGMPCNYTYSPQPANVFKSAGEVLTLGVFGASKRHIGFFFVTFVGCYIMFLSFGCKPWLSIAGSIVYTLGSYNLIIIGAGHMNKGLVMATMAPIIGGIILCYKKKLLAGSIITLVFAGLNVYWSHQQVSYYLLLTIIILAVVYLIYAIKEKWFKYYCKATGVLAVVALLAVAPSVGILLPTNDYAKDSMRGGSELKSSENGEKSSGLETDYAFDWSYGKVESFTLLVPNFYGSDSHYNVGTDSELYLASKEVFSKQIKGEYVKAVMEYNPGVTETQAVRYVNSEKQIVNEVERTSAAQSEQFIANAPTYWGDQPFTEGAVYVGAIVCFLFVLGLIIVKGPERWWLLAAVLFTLVLAWGRNLSVINNFLFEYLPLYNKFRAPSMALVITTLAMCTLAILAVKRFIELINSAKVNEQKLAKVGLFVSFGITAFMTLFFALFGSSVFDFSAPGDESMSHFPGLVEALRNERASMLVSDALRSFLFIALAAGLFVMLLYKRSKPIKIIFVVALTCLFLFDMWGVAKRYLNDDMFQPKAETTAITFTETDEQIKNMDGGDKNYRVMNLTGSVFNEAFTSYKHNSIGGYSPAKLSRYQDLIDVHLSKMNMNVISMLNTRFIITEQGVLENTPENGLPGAFGNCWLVNDVVLVNGAKEEIEAIANIDKSVAYVDKSWSDALDGVAQYCNNEEGDSIVMTDYKNPGNIVYKSNSSAPKLAVFSEVYYKTWKAYIDGKEVKPIRANYVLRALPVPAGEHTIEFKCVDELMETSHKWSLYMSLLVGAVILGVVAFAIYRIVKKRRNRNVQVTKLADK